VEALKLEVADLRCRVEKLNEENLELRQKVSFVLSYTRTRTTVIQVIFILTLLLISFTILSMYLDDYF